MKFIIRNQAKIANKYLRFAKWKIRNISRKFGKVIYTEIYVSKIASSPELYDVTVKMGVPGPDIIVSARSKNLNELVCPFIKNKTSIKKSQSKKKLLIY